MMFLPDLSKLSDESLALLDAKCERELKRTNDSVSFHRALKNVLAVEDEVHRRKRP